MAQVENEKLCAILSYVMLIGIIWYFVDEKMKKSSLAKFHVKQAIILAILAVIVNVVGTVIPILGWFIILPIGSLIVLVLWILGIINAANEKEKELPLIGGFAKKLDF